MAEYLSDFEVVDNDFEYDGRPYRFEPEYTDEELFERRMRRQREEQLAREQQTAARPRIDANWWCSCGQCSTMPTEEECLCCSEWDLRPGDTRLDVSRITVSQLNRAVFFVSQK